MNQLFFLNLKTTNQTLFLYKMINLSPGRRTRTEFLSSNGDLNYNNYRDNRLTKGRETLLTLTKMLNLSNGIFGAKDSNLLRKLINSSKT